MTLAELKRIAKSEFDRDGQLSKGTRISIVEKARAGERFSIIGNKYDEIRIGAALRKSASHQIMTASTLEAGRRVDMNFNY